MGEFIRGNGLQKSDLRKTGFPAIHYGQIHTYYGTSASETVSFVDPTLAKRLRKARPGDLIIVTTSEDDKAVGKAMAWLGESEVAISGDAFVFRHDLEPKFASYFFQSEQFQRHKSRFITGTKVRRISGDDLAKIRIPVPPKVVQFEIVRVLDLFQSLEAELNAELEARRQQYAHYSESLLTLGGGRSARRIPLGDLASISRGASPRPIQAFLTDSEDGVPWIKIGDVAATGKYVSGTKDRVTQEGAAKSRKVHPGDFLLSNSMSFGRPYISKIEGCIHDGWLAISDFDNSFQPDFLYHLLRSNQVQLEFARRAGAGTVQNLNADIVKSIAVPAPPLDDQIRIAFVLDKFDELVNDLSAGLPAELTARRKQYEHYRNRLLTFEEAA